MMRTVIALLLLAALLQSCYKRGKIRVVNQVSSVRMNNISWGPVSLGGELLPGQSTEMIEVRKHDEKLPSMYTLNFTLQGNGNEVALRTREAYMLDEDDELTIVITDETPVR